MASSVTTRRIAPWFFVAAAFGMVSEAAGHPVPSQAHFRTITVSPRSDELCVKYTLEVDQLTVVTDLLGAGKERGLKKPAEFYETYLAWQAELLADQLIATLDGKPLTLRCLERRYEVLDHLRCEFLFVADWKLTTNTSHKLEFRDDTFLREPGKIKLALAESESIDIKRRTAPGSTLQARQPIDLQPGDDDKLRTIRAEFRLLNAPEIAAPVTLPASPVEESKNAAPGSSLVTLLEAPHGMAVMLVLAMLFGAAHALTPGHGKTMVAAYLVGERGTARHAIILGLVTTITHTGAVLLLAAVLYWNYRDAAPAQISAALGFIGGLLIAGLGLWLFLRRISGRADHFHLGGAGHSHNPDGTVTYHEPPTGWGRLIVLGISGGIVPCWDAVLLLMFAISARMLSLAVPLLLAFSLGLASVLVAIGLAVVYAKGMAGARWSGSRVFQALPLVSAAILVVLGLLLCRDSLNLPTPG